MTWHTPEGDRHLQGPEGRAFRAALRNAIEMLEMGTLDCGGTLLARQTRKSLLHLFNYVGRHLLRETDPKAPLNAWTEGAVGVIFRQLPDQIANELFFEDESDDRHKYHWRELVWAAASQEAKEALDDDSIDLTCSQRDVWEYLCESLRDQVLWDTDWEVNYEWSFAEHMQTLGIDQKYFDWRLRINIKTKEAIRQLGDLCGYRLGEWEGQES